MREGLPQFSHPISHRTPEYRMGKDSIRLLAAIKKRLNFQTQRDRKIQGKINSNSLGNRWRSAVLVCHLATDQLTAAEIRHTVDAGEQQ